MKALFLSFLYNDLIYIIDSEPELARRYADLLLLRRPAYRAFQLFDLLIEFKYVELSAVALTAESVRTKSQTELHALTPIKDAFTVAGAALRTYRQTLQTKYGAILNLRVYAVVSLGFERLLWQEVP